MAQALTIAAPRAFPKGSPAHEGCHPLTGPIEEQPYLDNVESDARRGIPRCSAHWVEWCTAFLAAMIGGGGNDALRHLLLA
eukprot:1537646-Pyramimonas_sp.AAC.1